MDAGYAGEGRLAEKGGAGEHIIPSAAGDLLFKVRDTAEAAPSFAGSLGMRSCRYCPSIHMFPLLTISVPTNNMSPWPKPFSRTFVKPSRSAHSTSRW